MITSQWQKGYDAAIENANRTKESLIKMYEAQLEVFKELLKGETCGNCAGIKWKRVDGFSYPEALERMTFTHELSVEERNNMIEAYLIGYTDAIEIRNKEEGANNG